MNHKDFFKQYRHLDQITNVTQFVTALVKSNMVIQLLKIYANEEDIEDVKDAAQNFYIYLLRSEKFKTAIEQHQGIYFIYGSLKRGCYSDSGIFCKAKRRRLKAVPEYDFTSIEDSIDDITSFDTLQRDISDLKNDSITYTQFKDSIYSINDKYLQRILRENDFTNAEKELFIMSQYFPRETIGQLLGVTVRSLRVYLCRLRKKIENIV